MIDQLKRPLIFAFASFFIATAAHADAPSIMTYQGRLQEAGALVTGTRQVDIRLCDNAGCGGGAANVYDTGTQGVSVVNGLFRTTFTAPTGAANFLNPGTNWYLEVSVAGTPLLPRELLAASAFSIAAGTAQFVSATGVGPGTLQVTGGNLLVTGGNKVGIGTALPDPTISLDVNGAAQFGTGPTKSTFTSAGFLVMGAPIVASTINVSGQITGNGNGGNGLVVLSNVLVAGGNRVGIGTTNPDPTVSLDVNGSAQFGTGPTKSTFTSAGFLVMGAPIIASTINVSGQISGTGNGGQGVVISTNVLFANTANDSYIAYPFTAAVGGGIPARQAVILSGANTVNNNGSSASPKVIGITVTSAPGSGTIWVATHGIVRNVPCSGGVGANPGDLLQTNAGTVFPFVGPAAGTVVGRALTVSACSGALVDVLVSPQ